MKTFLLLLLLSSAAWANPSRETAPPPLPPKPLVLPSITKTRLSNGLTAWIVERHQVPVVQVNLVLDAGAEEDLAGQFGLASLTADLLTEGAAGRSSLEIADELDFLGAELVAASDFDSATVGLHVPVARLAPALAVMRSVVTEPDFPEAEIERRRAEIMTEFLQARDDPSGLMSLVFPGAIYPSDHRYGTLRMGSEEAIAKLSRQQLVAFHAAAYRPENSAVIVVGDVDSAKMVKDLEATFGSWKAAAPALAAAPLPPVAQVKGRRVVLVDKPGAAQTVIRIARLGVDRKTADYFPLTVLNTVLGGSFTSRLNQNLREDHGYTYGARSLFDMRHLPGPFYAAASVQTDKTGPALQEFFKELEAIRQPLSAQELSKAKNYLAYGFPSGFLTTAQLASELEAAWTYGLDEDFLSSYVQRVQAVSAADVQRAAAATIVPEDMVIVMVGDRAAILPQLEGLELGEIQLVKP